MKQVQIWLAGFFGMFFAVFAQAASVLDTSTTTAITGGFTDLQDTILALINLAWPFLIAVAVILMTPRVVSKLIKLVGGH